MAILLVDGDILVYQAIASAEKEVEWQPDLFTLWSDLRDAKDAFLTSLSGIIRRADQEHGEPIGAYYLALSDKTNWRKSVYPEYKSNRKNLRKPLGFAEFRQWVQDSYPTIIKPTLEADDVIGILATKPGNDAIIWSIDKDFNTIPGKHLKPEGIVEVSEESADYYHMLQTLTGDTTDGYPGCKGVGKVKAAQILNVRETVLEGQDAVDLMRGRLWRAVYEAYLKAGFTVEDALVQARVARICRWNDWDQQKQEVKLWTP